MSADDPSRGTKREQAAPALVDTLYWLLAQRVTEFVSTPLNGSAHSVCGMVHPHETTARIFVFDGDDLATAIGIDFPLLDADGQQINHFRTVSMLRRVLATLNDDANISWSVDGRGVRVVDAQAFLGGADEPAAGLGEAIYGAVSGTFVHFDPQPPPVAQTLHPVGFLAQSPEVVRVYFHDPATNDVCGYDVPIAGEGGLALAAGGFLTARIRELAGTGVLPSREVAPDPYCARAYSVR
ncbi:hypothetical protein [Actinokineospora bangkokensis]|uniref:Uncharacterized protein n=1 Tax=Actinokineospora bangkokensis TaxID=1193682 RepID=A0A1Q9LS09_9PSEU|nr:hypothetical protein [Actinokineospora bangkokensis]OLR94791.1 hypothetical protein BJP25_09130 [Actinokineospora bangkokensis]